MDRTQPQGKIEYVKPEAFDLGAVTPAVGGSCTGGNYPTGKPTCSTGNWFSYCFTGIGGSQTL